MCSRYIEGIFLWKTHERHPTVRPWVRNVGCRSWVRSLTEVCHCNYCAMRIIVLYMAAVYREFNKHCLWSNSMIRRFVNLPVSVTMPFPLGPGCNSHKGVQFPFYHSCLTTDQSARLRSFCVRAVVVLSRNVYNRKSTWPWKNHNNNITTCWREPPCVCF